MSDTTNDPHLRLLKRAARGQHVAIATFDPEDWIYKLRELARSTYPGENIKSFVRAGRIEFRTGGRVTVWSIAQLRQGAGRGVELDHVLMDVRLLCFELQPALFRSGGDIEILGLERTGE